MKKVINVLLAIAFFMCYVATPAIAITWVNANQATFAWDAVTTDGDGDPIPAGFTIKYVVRTVAAGADKATAVIEDYNGDGVGNDADAITATQATVTFAAKGSYIVGTESLQVEDSTGDIVSRSQRLSWSDNPADCQGGVDFGIRFFADLPATGGHRPVGGP